MRRADSMRMTASIAAWVSEAVTTTDQTTVDRPEQGGSRPACRLPAAGGYPERSGAGPARAVIGGGAGSAGSSTTRPPSDTWRTGRRSSGRAPPGWSRPVYLADRGFAVTRDAQEPLRPLDCLVLVADFHQRPSADQLLGLGEWPISAYISGFGGEIGVDGSPSVYPRNRIVVVPSVGGRCPRGTGAFRSGGLVPPSRFLPLRRTPWFQIDMEPEDLSANQATICHLFIQCSEPHPGAPIVHSQRP